MALSSAAANEILSRTVRSSWPIWPSICAISACSRSIDAESSVASRNCDIAAQSWPMRSVASLICAKRCASEVAPASCAPAAAIARALDSTASENFTAGRLSPVSWPMACSIRPNCSTATRAAIAVRVAITMKASRSLAAMVQRQVRWPAPSSRFPITAMPSFSLLRERPRHSGLPRASLNCSL